nr:MAG TPA: hypothetical protein [Caudoviricetes sp.]
MYYFCCRYHKKGSPIIILYFVLKNTILPYDSFCHIIIDTTFVCLK